MANRLDGGTTFTGGPVSFGSGVTCPLPSGTVTDSMVATPSAGQGVGAAKLNHAVEKPYRQNAIGDAAATVVADAGSLIYSARAGGTIQGVRAWVVTKATGADRTVNVDVQKAADGGAFATILTATILFDNTGGTVNLTEKAGSLSVSTYSAKDKFKVIVTVAGAAGAQAIGLGVVLDLFENGT